MNTYKTKLLQNIEAMKEKLASMEEELNTLEKIKHFPSKGDNYIYCFPSGTLDSCYNRDGRVIPNVYETREEAREAHNKAVAIEKVKRRIKELQGDWKPDWTVDAEEKFCIMYDHAKRIFITDCWYVTEHFQILPYMENKTIATTIINEMEGELELILL